MRMNYLVTGGFLAAMIAGSAQAATFGMNETALTLGDEGRTLVTLAGMGSGSEVTLKDEAGKSIKIADIDFRPNTGELFGYSNVDDTVYLIDPATGASVAVASLKNGASGDIGFDFNNVIDKARIVSSNDDNLVFTPGSSAIAAVTSLSYAAADANAGTNPKVSMNAYTNAVPMAASTVQFVIDSGLNILATLANNTGIVSTVGAFYLDGIAFDLSDVGGFDILSTAEGENMAVALLSSMPGASTQTRGIFTFDLMADANGQINLTRLVDLSGTSGRYDGFAVMATPSAVPVPASVLLLGGAMAGLGALRMRRKAAKTKA